MFNLLFIAILGLNPAWAGDELLTPVIVGQVPASVSQNETSLGLATSAVAEDLEIQIDPSVLEGASEGLRPFEEAAPVTVAKKSYYRRTLEKLQTTLPLKMKKFFTKVHLPQEVQDSVILGISSNLSRATEALANSNSKGVSLPVIGFVGLGLNEKIEDQIRKNWWGRWMPRYEGLGVVLSAGTAVLTFKSEGRRKIIIRFFADAGKTDKMINWMAEGMAGVAPGYVSESIDEALLKSRLTIRKREMRRSQMGPLGSIVTSEDSFEHAFAAGVQLPPVVSAFSFFEFKVHRAEFNVLLDVERVSWLKRKTVNSCRWVLGRKNNRNRNLN